MDIILLTPIIFVFITFFVTQFVENIIMNIISKIFYDDDIARNDYLMRLSQTKEKVDDKDYWPRLVNRNLKKDKVFKTLQRKEEANKHFGIYDDAEEHWTQNPLYEQNKIII